MHCNEEYVTSTFTNVLEYIDYVVPFVKRGKTVITRLVSLVTDEGFVFSNMPVAKYLLEYDIEDIDLVTLNHLEFRDGEAVDYLKISKLFGSVTGRGNAPYGNLKSIELNVTVYPHHSPYHDEKGGEHELRPIVL